MPDSWKRCAINEAHHNIRNWRIIRNPTPNAADRAIGCAYFVDDFSREIFQAKTKNVYLSEKSVVSRQNRWETDRSLLPTKFMHFRNLMNWSARRRRKILGYFALPLLLLQTESSGNSAPPSPENNPQTATQTIERLIVASGTVIIDLDLNRLSGIARPVIEAGDIAI